MKGPVTIDIETVRGTAEQLQTYRDIKCAKCAHNPELHPKQKKDYCTKCDDEAALRWHTSQTVCITAKPLGQEAVCFCDAREEVVLEQAFEYLEEIAPRPYVGFNVKDFDIVHLKMRGMVRGIPFVHILPQGKYDKNCVDLYDVLVEGKWNKQQSASLEMFAAMLGFKELLYGHGSQVPNWFLNGELDEIKKHNIGDVLATEQLYMRYANIYSDYKKRKESDFDEVITI